MYFTFPVFRQIYGITSYFSWEFIKFQARKMVAASAVHEWERIVNQAGADWVKLFSDTPKLSYPILHTYLDKQIARPNQKIAVMCHDVAALQNWAKGAIFRALVRGEKIQLASISEDLFFQLIINDLDINEGLWSVQLMSQTYGRMYAATFGLLPENQFLITSLQGPRGEHGKDRVRELTKQLHGLRPQHLTVAFLQMLADVSGCLKIIGIAQDNQVKLRWKLKKRVSMNYNEFWQECGAKPQASPNSNWLLPREYTRKPESEIASKKRSMYRKRYEMLDQLHQQLNNVFQAV